jgi:hypothetical protein
MTEFMIRVQQAVSTPGFAVEGPAVVASRPRSVGHGAHEMVELRSLAEQLICEANAVLAASGRSIELIDQAGDQCLAFTLRSNAAWADVVTSFAQRQSWGQLVTPHSAGEPFELTGPDALGDLILALIAADPSASEMPIRLDTRLY